MSINDIKFRCVAGAARLPWDKRDDWQKKAFDYRVFLSYQGRRMSLDFWQGQAIDRDPTLSGVLDCFFSDSVYDGETFEEWASELGYDTDSRKAFATWQAVQKQNKAFRRLFGDDFDVLRSEFENQQYHV